MWLPYGARPKKVNGQLTLRTEYYREYLTTLAKGRFKIDCSDDWEYDYILETLMFEGFFIMTRTDAGVLPLKGTTVGYSYNNFPTNTVIVVPTLPQMERTIGVDCELVYLEFRNRYKTFTTLQKLIDIYAEKLASLDGSVDVNIMNSRLAYIAEAETKAQADTIKELFDQVSEGSPLVVYRKDNLSQIGLQVFFGNVRQNFIVPELQDARKTIINEFLSRISINNTDIDKKERLVVDEANANNEEIEYNVSLWKKNLAKCVRKVNAMFPDVKFNIEFDQSNLQRGECDDTVRHSGDMEDKES